MGTAEGTTGQYLGWDIANVGDLDQDGFADFAVGSPFENEGKGVIRLYYGRADIENINSAIQKDLIIKREGSERPDFCQNSGIDFRIQSPTKID